MRFKKPARSTPTQCQNSRNQHTTTSITRDACDRLLSLLSTNFEDDESELLFLPLSDFSHFYSLISPSKIKSTWNSLFMLKKICLRSMLSQCIYCFHKQNEFADVSKLFAYQFFFWWALTTKLNWLSFLNSNTGYLTIIFWYFSHKCGVVVRTFV